MQILQMRNTCRIIYKKKKTKRVRRIYGSWMAKKRLLFSLGDICFGGEETNKELIFKGSWTISIRLRQLVIDIANQTLIQI